MGKIVLLSDFVFNILPTIGDQTIAYTNGCFDIIHRGHLASLSWAASKADILIVGLNSDKSVFGIKGPGRPIKDQLTRAQVLEAMHFVDYVIIFDEPTPESHIREILPDIIVKGFDYKKKEVVGEKIISEFGGWVEYAPFLKGHSTTGILNEAKQKMCFE